MKIGFFGCGNMGAALAEGFKKNSSVEQYFYTPSQTKARKLAEELGGTFVEKAADMPADLDWYILAFKPQSLSDFTFNFRPDAKVLSVLAGTGMDSLKQKFNIESVARLMPNTPSSVGMGANLFFSEFDSQDMKNLLGSIGVVFTMKTEKELDMTTAFSGSGPALIFEFARLFEKHLGALSGESEDTRKIIAQTFLGSAKLMEKAIHDGVSLETLREQVTSKKGVTYEALQILEKNNLDQIMGGAFNSAYKRTLEIKKGI